ncbi:leucine-rich colipase-like protein 1 [Delphinus delphis]|uniref:leucine-rich colipase-like protein 1 n=1 Tax=Delphinus delphis TaxID=9728 RepID=UPI0028C4C12D|nr:leucine-rich colipase-like protein 1 [Delphinus delphis]
MEKAWEGEGQEPCGRGLSGANRPRATASTGRLLLLWLRPATLVTTRGTHPPRSHKPNGHTCLDHTECWSGCCVTSSYGLQTYCTAKTIFLQCVPWCKPNGDYRTDHGECRSKCCVQPNEVDPHRCVPRSGVLVQCLPWKKELSEAAPQDAGPEDTTEDGVGGPQREVGHGDRRGTASGWETTLWCPSSDSGTRDCSLTEKVCRGPEGESQSFLSTPTWPVSTQSGGGCRGATTVSPRVSRGCRRQPGRSAGSLAQRRGLSVPRTVWPLQSSCPKAASPRAFPNFAVSSSDLDPVCALETCLDPEPRTCSGCSSRDGENLQVSDV